MSAKIDEIDRKILNELQVDGTLSVDALSERVYLSRNACWRRVKRMEDEGIIKARVALVDPELAGCSLAVFVLIRTQNHDKDWLALFRSTMSRFPEVVNVYRMSGEIDYVLKVRVSDMKAYDRLYKRLIESVPLSDVSASFVMEEIKETTAVPLDAI